MKILIDNGHGENTPGKRSPDGTFRSMPIQEKLRMKSCVNWLNVAM